MNGYRKIIVNDINLEAKGIINELFSLFPQTDMFCQFQNGYLIIFLRELDFFFFKNVVFEYIQKFPKHQKILQKILYSIENIKSYGLKGFKRLYVGYNKERKVKNRTIKEMERGKYFYAREHNFSKKNNQLPQKFVNKIIVGDSEIILKEFPDNCIDLIFTSPPYNFGLEYETHKDGINWEDYFHKLFTIFEECI
ncbi:MAG TPA: site-specific DNA-methyltransferase, partial [bacterium]|nr:site-specific DNA-methyltransferase [bacterium]